MFASFNCDTLNRGTQILRADSPLGPFVPHSNGTVTPKDWVCLDGTLHIEPDGTPYMVFCHEWVQVKDGGHGMIFTSLNGERLFTCHQPNKTNRAVQSCTVYIYI